MMILNSTDLKDDNNAIYERRSGDRVAGRWYVVKDLGATLGTTGRVDPEAQRHRRVRAARVHHRGATADT